MQECVGRERGKAVGEVWCAGKRPTDGKPAAAVTQRTFQGGGPQTRNWEGRIKTQVREMKNRQPRVGGNVGSMKGQPQQMK